MQTRQLQLTRFLIFFPLIFLLFFLIELTLSKWICPLFTIGTTVKNVTTERTPHTSIINYFYQHTTYSIILISLFLIAICISIMASRSYDKIPYGHVIDQYTLNLQQYISHKIKNIKELPISNQRLFLNYDDLQYEEVYPLSTNPSSLSSSSIIPDNNNNKDNIIKNELSSISTKSSSVEIKGLTTVPEMTESKKSEIMKPEKKLITIIKTKSELIPSSSSTSSSSSSTISPTTTTTTSPPLSPTIPIKKQTGTMQSSTGPVVHDKRKRKKTQQKHYKKKDSNNNNKRYNQLKEKNDSNTTSLSTNEENGKYLTEMALSNKTITLSPANMDNKDKKNDIITTSNISTVSIEQPSASDIKKFVPSKEKHVMKEMMTATPTTTKENLPLKERSADNKLNLVNSLNSTAVKSTKKVDQQHHRSMKTNDDDDNNNNNNNNNTSIISYSIAPSPPSSTNIVTTTGNTYNNNNNMMSTDGIVNRQSWYSPFNTGLEFDILSRSPPSPTHTYNSSSSTSSPPLSSISSSFNYTDYRLFPEPSRLPVSTTNFIQQQPSSHLNNHSSLTSINNNNNMNVNNSVNNNTNNNTNKDNTFYNNIVRNFYHPYSSSSSSSSTSPSSSFHSFHPSHYQHHHQHQQHRLPSPPPPSSSSLHIPLPSTSPIIAPPSSTSPISNVNSTTGRDFSSLPFSFNNTNTSNWYYPWKSSRTTEEIDHEQGTIPLNNNIKNNEMDQKSSTSFSLFDRKLSFYLQSDK